jgi:hypothetical protein
MIFARRVFRTAGIYGLVVTLPQLFLERLAHGDARPDIYYGFVGTVLAWQVAFLLIGRDPVRYRPLMLVSLIEKGVFAVAVPILYLQGRVPGPLLVFAGIDVILGLLFIEAWRRTTPPPVRDTFVEKQSSDPTSDTEVLVLDFRRVMDPGIEN